MTDSQHATQLALQRYLDNETTVAESSAIQQHLSTCSTCASAIAESARLKRAVSLHANRYQPSSDFRQRIAAQLAPALARKSFRWRPLALATLAVLLLVLATPVIRSLRPPSAPSAELAEAMDLHVTALASSNPVDVVSTDRHTVKPWFQGKIPFAFNLPELAGSPYTLDGGRVAYLHHQACAQLIYSLRQHHLSVFVCPGSGLAPSVTAKVPFRAASWTSPDLHYYAISDADLADIQSLQHLWQYANPS